jgi:hypothetical protein
MKDNALYLEVDEDITSAIDKLSKSAPGPVQIVVPKRSSLLQSIINLKLLKKAAESTNKELVLVTSDRIATELAARVGLAVAPAIGAKPVIAEAQVPETLKNTEEIIESDDPEPPPLPVSPKPVVTKKPLLVRTPLSDDTALAPAGAVAAAQASSDAQASGAPKKVAKVPNFARLQRRILWVGLAVLLIVGYLSAMYFLTSAKVTLYAAGTRVSIDTTFAVDPSLKATDPTSTTLAGQLVTVTKDLSGGFVPSGKKDIGTKATGNVVIQNCEDSNVYPLAAGNTLTSQGLSFVTSAAVTIPAGTFTNGGKNCTSPTVTVAVSAAQNGDNYNLTNASFASPKLTANFKLTSGQLSGGTTKTVNVVAQSDVDAQQAALLEKDKENASRDVAAKVPSGYTQLSSSMTTSATASPSPAVGSEGDTGTLSLKVTYSVLAVKQSDYTALLNNQEQKQVGSGNQIYDNGLSNAQVTTNGSPDSSGRQSFHFTTDAYGGTKLDTAAIANKLKSQRYGDAVNTASGLPGVDRATVSISPAWASKMPSRPAKITITIQISAK